MAILALSRHLGSGGREIGQAIAQSLGYDYIDRKQLMEAMRASGEGWEQDGEHFDEATPSVWERAKWSFRGFVALTQKHILERACKDNQVIIGRGVPFLVKGIPHALRVLVTAPHEKRIARVMERQEMNREDADWLIHRVDREMMGAVYLIYGKKWNDPAEYDMTLDTGSAPLPAIVEQIRSALLRRDQLRTDRADKVLGLRTLAAQIRAEIATDRTLHVSTLSVKPKESDLVEHGLIVRGVTWVRSDIDRVKEITKARSGDVPVEFDLQMRMIPRFGQWEFK
jgi:cytidylate kinase